VALTPSPVVVSGGWDNCLKVSPANGAGDSGSTTTALSGQPRGVVCNADLLATATATEVILLSLPGLEPAASAGELGYQPTCLALSSTGEVVVGGSDNSTHVYAHVDRALSETHKFETRSAVSSVAVSSDGTTMAVGDNGRQIEVFKKTGAGAWESHIKGKWVFHTSKVTSLAFSPSGDRVASGGLDESIFIWRVSNPAARYQIKFAHNTGVATVAWTAEDTLVSTGSDGCIATWKVPETAA